MLFKKCLLGVLPKGIILLQGSLILYLNFFEIMRNFTDLRKKELIEALPLETRFFCVSQRTSSEKN